VKGYVGEGIYDRECVSGDGGKDLLAVGNGCVCVCVCVCLFACLCMRVSLKLTMQSINYVVMVAQDKAVSHAQQSLLLSQAGTDKD